MSTLPHHPYSIYLGTIKIRRKVREEKGLTRITTHFQYNLNGNYNQPQFKLIYNSALISTFMFISHFLDNLCGPIQRENLPSNKHISKTMNILRPPTFYFIHSNLKNCYNLT
jgi:hypothetical protein